ncbi:thymidylate synthase [Xenorhabdus szentirmaii]|uniref:thymidylate synthase n=1 Tax=Xenorhabdus szentirmaii DSM 16338 TaxID=1427518 RepID=W1IT88_9GAMM|nr:thymidylate synthase [Xenorhabdus szentirmaii]PHM30570.1 thymidylate synthase [Xenorhabdus szentirmaii DSM 16338]CDL81038.1 putative thymidylate synthase [Xenorhabdus szentirmaii DSM 16338]
MTEKKSPKNNLSLINDESYRDIVADIVVNGFPSSSERTGVGTSGISFIPSFYYLNGGLVPMISGKAVNQHPLLVELEWYFRGLTNVRFLNENGVKIWDLWANENGDLGPVYGKQWRKWRDTRVVTPEQFEQIKHRGYVVDGELTDGRLVVTREIDQLQRIVDNLRNDPENRRNIMLAWNVGELEDMALPPCHFAFGAWSRELDPVNRLMMAFNIGVNHIDHNVDSKYASFALAIKPVMESNNHDYNCFMDGLTHKWLDHYNIPRRVLNTGMVQRSVDTFVGMPFNIAGYSIITHFLAHITDHMAAGFSHFGFDVHLYNNHAEGVDTYMKREDIAENDPIVVFPESWKELSDFNWQGISIFGYQSHPWIKAPVAK